jgi:hypothetical protein
MGEAKERALALVRGEPLPQDRHRCPRCFSRRTVIEMGPPMGLSHVPTHYGVCADCKTLWEAFPADWKHDVVEGSPCDNCAFSGKSPESEDREAWRELLAKLKGGNEFKCHKGAPMIIDAEAGTIEFDAQWVTRHGRMCAGFLKAMQTWPDWLAKHLGSVEIHGVDMGAGPG